MIAKKKKKIIAIGAGHNDKHPGVCVEYEGTLIREYDVAKVLEKRVTNVLETYGYVIYNFSGTLQRKVSQINKIKPVCAIELHFNCCKAHGGEILHYPSDKSTKLAYSIAKYLRPHVSKWRGIKIGYYRCDPNKPILYFLRKTICPAVIIEPAFLDSIDVDLPLIFDDNWFNLIAKAIAQGVYKYVGK